MNPKISIIIPIYNKSRYLNTVLEQIKNQSFKDFECILIDDGSNDGSAEICDSYSSADERFKVIHKVNGGVSAARNTGLDVARGNYITFIDADDEITENYLEILYAPAVESRADMVVGGCQKFWDDSDKTVWVCCPFEGLVDIKTVLGGFAEAQYKNGIYGICCNKLIPYRIVADIRFNPSIKLAEDLDFYLSVYPKLKSIYFLSERNYLYRQEAENSSVIINDKDIDYFSQLCIQLKMYKMLEGAAISSNAVVVNRIYDYVYFCVFYAPIAKLTELCERIKSMNLPVFTNFKSLSLKKRWVLKKFLKGSYKTLAFALKQYRKLKRV